MSNQIPFQQAALQTQPHTLTDALTAFLQLLVNAQNFDAPMALDLLQTLAEISPTCKAQLGDLSSADPQSIKNICQQLLQPKVMHALDLDMQRKMTAAKQQTMSEQEQWVKEIDAALRATGQSGKEKAELFPAERLAAKQLDWGCANNSTDRTRSTKAEIPSPQRQAALDETGYIVNSFIAARSDKAPFGDLGPLGHFIELALQAEVIAPLDAELYPRGFVFNPPETNSFKDHMRKMHEGKEIYDLNAGPAFKV